MAESGEVERLRDALAHVVAVAEARTGDDGGRDGDAWARVLESAAGALGEASPPPPSAGLTPPWPGDGVPAVMPDAVVTGVVGDALDWLLARFAVGSHAGNVVCKECRCDMWPEDRLWAGEHHRQCPTAIELRHGGLSRSGEREARSNIRERRSAPGWLGVRDGEGVAQLMIDGKRYTATLTTEPDARVWEVETRVAAALPHGAASVMFAAYAANWILRFVDDAPDRARFEAALEHRLVPVLGSQPLLEVMKADRDELDRRVLGTGEDGDDGAARQCLRSILADAVEDMHAGNLAAVVRV